MAIRFVSSFCDLRQSLSVMQEGHGCFFIGIAMAWLLSLGVFSAAANAADIRSTQHNMAQKGSQVEIEEVCVFCHTPQISKLSATSGTATVRPAWQPSLPENHDFAMFDDIGRKQFGKAAVGSQSIACLSCHDGNQAFAVMGTISDHPFGVPYRGYTKAKGTAAVAAGVKRDAPSRAAEHLKFTEDFRAPSKGVVEDRTVWWVSPTEAKTVRTRLDLPLYAHQAEGGDEIPYIECSSCHDPHLAGRLFLRGGNAGSRLCLTCHTK